MARADRVDRILEQWHVERPDLDTAPMAVVGRVSRASRLLEKGVDEVLDRHGVGGGLFDVLATLRRTGPPFRLTPGALAAATMVTSGAVTARLDRLVGRGLVSREVDPANRRSVLVTLTAEGRRLVDTVLEEHLANEARLLASLGPRDRDRLAALLRQLLVGLGDVPG